MKFFVIDESLLGAAISYLERQKYGEVFELLKALRTLNPNQAPLGILQVTANYLSSRPYNEVAPMMEALQQLKEIKEDDVLKVVD